MLPLVLDFYVRALLLVFYQLYSTIPGVLLCTGRQGDIVSFDLHNEVCTVVPLPCSVSYSSDILDFEGSAGVIFESIGERSEICLWTIEHIDGKISWTKKLNILIWVVDCFLE